MTCRIPIHPTFVYNDAPVFFSMYDGDYVDRERDESIEFHFEDDDGEHIDGYSLFRLHGDGIVLTYDVDNFYKVDTTYDTHKLVIIGVDLL